MNTEALADNLLSTEYTELKAYLSNEQSKLNELPLDAPELFDIPVIELLLNNLEGGVIANHKSFIYELECLIQKAAEKVADSMIKNDLEL